MLNNAEKNLTFAVKLKTKLKFLKLDSFILSCRTNTFMFLHQLFELFISLVRIYIKAVTLGFLLLVALK